MGILKMGDGGKLCGRLYYKTLQACSDLITWDRCEETALIY